MANACVTCVKYLMFAFNFLFWVSGSSSLGHTQNTFLKNTKGLSLSVLQLADDVLSANVRLSYRRPRLEV